MQGELTIRAFDGSQISLTIPEDLGLRVFLLQELLRAHAKRRENCYVSFGTVPGDQKDEQQLWDPPKRFLGYYSDLLYYIKPVSAYPKRDDKQPPKNPDTGVADGIYTVEILAWLDDDTAKVRTGVSRNGYPSTGEPFVVKKHDRGWQRAEKLTVTE